MKLKVCDKMCNECLFTPNRIVEGERKDEILTECLSQDKWFECHKGTIAGTHIICRGFYNMHKNDIWPLRLAQMVNMIEFVEVKA